jgi:hypothetical protein
MYEGVSVHHGECPQEIALPTHLPQTPFINLSVKTCKQLLQVLFFSVIPKASLTTKICVELVGEHGGFDKHLAPAVLDFDSLAS